MLYIRREKYGKIGRGLYACRSPDSRGSRPKNDFNTGGSFFFFRFISFFSSFLHAEIKQGMNEERESKRHFLSGRRPLILSRGGVNCEGGYKKKNKMLGGHYPIQKSVCVNVNTRELKVKIPCNNVREKKTPPLVKTYQVFFLKRKSSFPLDEPDGLFFRIYIHIDINIYRSMGIYSYINSGWGDEKQEGERER